MLSLNAIKHLTKSRWGAAQTTAKMECCKGNTCMLSYGNTSSHRNVVPPIDVRRYERAAAAVNRGGAERQDQVADAGLAEALLRVSRLQDADQVLPVAQDRHSAHSPLIAL